MGQRDLKKGIDVYHDDERYTTFPMKGYMYSP